MHVESASRTRFGSLAEWSIAAAFLFATLIVAYLIARELRAVSAPAAGLAQSPAASAQPPAVPADAISVPALLLFDGRRVRVGDTLTAVAAHLGRAAEVGVQHVDRGALGERLTRMYDHAGTRFILVFEPFERQGEPRVAAIYIQ